MVRAFLDPCPSNLQLVVIPRITQPQLILGAVTLEPVIGESSFVSVLLLDEPVVMLHVRELRVVTVSHLLAFCVVAIELLAVPLHVGAGSPLHPRSPL